jgi:NADPH:quinone reductase-like Zn-dependent oxidoreductase
MYAIQLAKLNGAEVTGVDNAEKLEFMRSLGADHVIDYTRDDFTRTGRTYDLILDLAAHRPAFAYQGSLLPGGRYLYVGGSVATLLQVLLTGPVLGRAAGKIATVIGRRYRLSQVPEALRYLGEGHAQGKIVVIVK